MSTTPLKVAVTGAAGQIGYSLLFRLASGSLLRVQLVPFLLFINLMLLLNWALFAVVGMHRAATGQTFTYPMTLGRT